MSEDNWLELRTSENGPAQKIPITEIGGTVRIAVGEPGRRSSIWYIQAGKNSHCVYIFAQTLGGTQKFSLHQSGDWRYAFTSEFMEDPKNTEFVDQLDDRVRDSWRRPEGEIVWGPSIRVRGEDVTALDDSALRRPQQVIWLPAPPVGSATAIDMIFFQPHTLLELKGYAALACLILSNGEGLLVVATTREVSSETLTSLAGWTDQAVQGSPPELKHLRGTSGMRLSLFGHDDQGQRFVWDTAF